MPPFCFLGDAGLTAGFFVPAIVGRVTASVREVWMPLSSFVCNEVTQYLRERDGAMRPPDKAAGFLIYVVQLHRRRAPFPPRKEAAEYIGCSVGQVDTQLSARLATGDISIKLEVAPGFVKRRLSTIRHRMVIPSDEIVRVVQQAEADEKEAKR